MKPSDFDWTSRGVTVRETGAFVPFNLALFKDIYIWWQYYRREKARKPAFQGPQRPVFVHPRAVQNVYLLWGAMRQAGLDNQEGSLMSSESNETDLHLYFSDQTYLDNHPSAPTGINRDCTDISKSRVAEVFETIFGYNLSVDPRTAQPPFICKSELNGKHDGYIAYKNCAPKDGWVYQKLIMAETEDGTVIDHRCPTVFGEVPLVYLKERPIDQRFANLNTRCRLSQADLHFTTEELRLIRKFCKAMKLDWGGLDILRNAPDGRIYIVDVNKTDMGPPLALPLKDKLKSTEILGLALRQAVDFHFPPAITRRASISEDALKKEERA
jgi:hypothetical protein